jgi:hypothetical protein
MSSRAVEMPASSPSFLSTGEAVVYFLARRVARSPDIPDNDRLVSDGGFCITLDVFLLHLRSKGAGDLLPVSQCEHFPAHASPDSLARSPEPPIPGEISCMKIP